MGRHRLLVKLMPARCDALLAGSCSHLSLHAQHTDRGDDLVSALLLPETGGYGLHSAMLLDFLALPQIVALAVLIQRGLEELYSARNTRRLLSEGAHEEGRDYYPVVAVTHLAWIAAIFLLIPPHTPVSWPLAAAYLVLQAARYWVIATLGRYWTHRIITLDQAPVVRRGPYRYLRHPNYVVTVVETFLLPMVFGAWAIALVMGAVWTAVIRYKIVLEDRAIAGRTSGV